MTHHPNVELMEAIKTVVTQAYEAQYSPEKALVLVRDIYWQHTEKEHDAREPMPLSREISK